MSASLEETFLPVLPVVDGKPRLDMGSVLIESTLLETPIGAVFLGQHTGLGAPVVARVLHPRMKAQLKDFQRFADESRRLGQIRHSNIAGVLNVGEYLDYHYMIMEYVSGVPMSERLAQRHMSEAQALALLIPIAEGLVEFWRQGFVHRGVCPHMIHIQSDGTPKLNLSLLRRNYRDPQLVSFLEPSHAPYWSPEEVRGQPVDATSDMWSFGATLYHAVTGKTPYPTEHSSLGTLATMMINDPVDPRDANPDIREATRELLLKLLARKTDDRFMSAEAFLSALRSVQSQISGKALHDQTLLMPETPKPGTPRPHRNGDIKISGVGEVIGNCRIIKKLGAGAFGVVYLGRHRVLEIDVAVKVLPMESAYRDPSFVEMFMREARTAARIRHPNVIGIFEAGEHEGQHFIIMELASGGTVAERMFYHGGKLPVHDAEQILLQAARGLSAAQRLNIIHRDIKPDNLMFSADGEVKIADLGLAKRFIPAGATGTIRASLAADQLSMKNDPGMMAGTPAYMAPEIAVEPEKADSRADLYSLGVTAYQMLTGQLPFEGKTPMETIMKHVLDTPVPPKEIEPAVPHDLELIVLKLLQKKPEHRFQTADDLVRELEFLHTPGGMMATL